MASKKRHCAPVALTLALVLCWTPSMAAQSHPSGCENPLGDRSKLRFNARGWKTDFCLHAVPFEEIQSGGPPRDGIPPIDEPRLESIAEADQWIGDREPVILLEIKGKTRVYPLQIMVWHEIVNDELADIPVAVTFCPLCYTAIVFERPTIDGEKLTFGTTGNLRHSDLVMWDRQTESWWQQFDGRAIVGRLVGMRLESLPVRMISWSELKKRYTDAQVLSKETGYPRRYGENPYVGYDDVGKSPWLFEGPVDDALRPMERVVGVEVGRSARAYRLRRLKEEKVLQDTIGGTPVVVFWTPEAASGVDKREIAHSRRIGSVGVYRATLDGRRLDFESDGKDRFQDYQTGSIWNIFGESIDGSLAGRKLDPLVHHNTFWFVWSVFRPESPLRER